MPTEIFQAPHGNSLDVSPPLREEEISNCNANRCTQLIKILAAPQYGFLTLSESGCAQTAPPKREMPDSLRGETNKGYPNKGPFFIIDRNYLSKGDTTFYILVNRVHK